METKIYFNVVGKTVALRDSQMSLLNKPTNWTKFTHQPQLKQSARQSQMRVQVTLVGEEREETQDSGKNRAPM